MVLRGIVAALSSLSCPSWIPDCLSHRWPWPVILYPCLCLLTVIAQKQTNGTQSFGPVLRSPADAALIDLIKLALGLCVFYISAKRRSDRRGNTGGSIVDCARDEEQPLRDAENGDPAVNREVLEKRCSQETMRLGSVKSTAVITAAGLLLALPPLQSTADVDPAVFSLGPIFSGILAAFGLYSLLSRTFSENQFIVITLQTCGIALTASALMQVDPYSSPYIILLSSSLITALAVILIDFVYQSHDPDCYNIINPALFASGLCIHVVAYTFQSLTAHATTTPQSPHSYSTLHHLILLLIAACTDYSALFIIYCYDAAFERVLASCAVPAILVITSPSSNRISIKVLLGCVVVLWATSSYITSQFDESRDSAQHSSRQLKSNFKHRIIGIVVFAILIIGSAYGTVHSPVLQSSAMRPGHGMSVTGHPSACQRRPLPLPPLRPPENRTYHHFDDVLLIVFFSHARYNVNLEYYRTVYSDYFPNMVFIGPASRENAGFNHSYDVVVDSYQADEDLSDPNYYKMAGRMAHHMLYTGLKEFPCYQGYLWAPFDTLLNVPRLQQFDQDLFWYHSPFAEYVYNPALGRNDEPERHAPPAQISPDPYLNLTAEWRGWGLDWWWGDPHVGLSECMPAFMKVPLPQRQRLAELTEGKTHFIGGSADTMYIPGRHREAFMETLGIFLETNCFLEITTPTALHLVVPPGEKILFVDHWWIWEPPLNATFVRDKWSEGYEVDTFHTFHWGDRDVEGVWRGDPDNIADVQDLLQESALRQHISLPAPIP